MRAVGILIAALFAVPTLAHSQTFSDPESYCKAVGTIDDPDARYVGPKTTEAMAKAHKRQLSQGGEYEWRCLQGRVMVCLTLNSPICGKASAVVTADIKDYCAQNPGADFIPTAIAGRDAQWACNGAKAIAKNNLKVDSRGFPVAYWKAIGPEAVGQNEKEAVEAALRSRIGEKLIFRSGSMLDGYALQGWTDSVHDVGGTTLLKFDDTKKQWVILDTDSVMEVSNLIAKGVPPQIANTLVGNLSARIKDKSADFAMAKMQVICRDGSQMVLAGGAVLTVILEQPSIREEWFEIEATMNEFLNYVKGKARAQCRSQGPVPETLLVGVGVRGQYGGIVGPVSVFGLPDGKWNTQQNIYRQKVLAVQEQARAARERAQYEERERQRQRAAEQERQRQIDAKVSARDGVLKSVGASRLVGFEQVSANPFLFKGQTIAVKSVFVRMISESDALFRSFSTQDVLYVAKAPNTAFAPNVMAILGLKVSGMRQLKPPLGEGNVAEVEFAGFYFCREQGCFEIPD